MQEERSQHKNKSRAMELLAARLYDMARCELIAGCDLTICSWRRTVLTRAHCFDSCFDSVLFCRQKVADKERDSRRLVVGTGDRSERIRTYNFPENRVTDHRINLTIFGVGEMLDSLKLDSFIDALELEDNTQKMVHLET